MTMFIHFCWLCPLGLATKLNLIYRTWSIVSYIEFTEFSFPVEREVIKFDSPTFY